MVDTTRQESILRELPEIEQYKTGLLGSSKTLVDAANKRAEEEGEYLTPDYQVAGMSPDQLTALQMGRTGIGAFQPYLTSATQGTATGSNTLGEAANVLRGADTRQQFGNAQQMANQYSQANMDQSMGTLGRAEGIAAGAGPTDFSQAQNTLGQGIGALQGAAQMYDPGNAQRFMNPYQQQVIDESIRQIDRQGDISRQNLQAQATRAGAFGGSREGIQRAELDRGLAEQKNAAIVGGLSQGYNQASTQAQQAFEQQQGRQLSQAQGLQGAAGLQGQFGQTQQQQALQQAQALQGIGGLYGQQSLQQAQLGQGAAGLQGNLANQQFGIGSQMAQGLGSLGTQQSNIGMQQAALGQQAQGMGQQDTNFLYNLGTAQQKQSQAEMDAKRQNTLQQNMQPYQQLGFLSDIYKGAPTSQMSITSSSAPTPSPFQQAAGLGIAAVGAAAAGQRAGVL